MAAEQQRVINADDLTDADESIIDVLAQGARTKGAIEDETGLHRNTVGNRLDVLEAGDVVERVHDRTALYELVDDPREDGDAADADRGAQLQDALAARDEAQAEARDLADDLEDCRAQLAECEEQLTGARETDVDVGQVRAGVRAALSALTGQRPDVETARAELERVQEVLGDE